MVSFKVLEKRRLEQQLATANAVTTEAVATEAKADRFDRLRKAITLKSVTGRNFSDTILSGASELLKFERLPMDVPELDRILGGGLPRGRIVEAYGPTGAGKTTLGLHAIAEAQKKGGNAAFIDAEHRLDIAYAQALGVDTDNLLVSRPHCGETAFNIVCQLVRSGAVDVVVIDSVAALIPEAELAGDVGDMLDSAHSALMSKGIQRLTSELNSVGNSHCLIIFLNQIRLKRGVVYGSPEITTGGLSLPYYASMRVELRRIQTLKRRTEEYGIKVKAKVIKSSVSTPFQSAEIDIVFGLGILAEVVSP